MSLGRGSPRYETTAALELLSSARARHPSVPLPDSVKRTLGAGLLGYGEYLALLMRIVSENVSGQRGGEVALHAYGTSLEKEPLFALSFGPPPRGALTRTTVVLSLVHPMEWVGLTTHLALVSRMVGTPIEGRSVVCVPMVNPDGYRRVERNLRAGKRGFVRHNARGVDLNRNFDASWGKLGFVQRRLRTIFSPGAGPASEPEVSELCGYLGPMRIDRAVSLHAFGGAVLFPYASRTAAPIDVDEHRSWSRRIATGADRARPYRSASCARWAKVTAGGLELDWFHERHGAVSLLVECTRGGLGLHPRRLFEPFAWWNPRDPRREVSRIADALEPFVLGLPR